MNELIILGGVAILVVTFAVRLISNIETKKSPSSRRNSFTEKIAKFAVKVLYPEAQVELLDQNSEINTNPSPQSGAIALMKRFEKAINESDINELRKIIAPENSILNTKLEAILRNETIEYSIPTMTLPLFMKTQNIDTVTFNLPQRVKSGYISSSGITAKFTLQRRNGAWFITESNVADRIGKEFSQRMLKIMLVIVVVIIIASYFSARSNSGL